MTSTLTKSHELIHSWWFGYKLRSRMYGVVRRRYALNIVHCLTYVPISGVGKKKQLSASYYVILQILHQNIFI